MRNIAREIFSDEFIGQLQVEYRLLWIGLVISIADDQGRMLDNAALIKAHIFPYDELISVEIIEHGLALFAKRKKILRYTAVNTTGGGRRLIQIINWWKHQSTAQWAARSNYPAPPRWVDRIRTHQGTQIVPINWDQDGGFSSSQTTHQRRSNVGPMKRQRRASVAPTKAEDKMRIRGEGKGEEKEPTPLPPALQEPGKKAAGGRADKTNSWEDQIQQLKPKQRKAARFTHDVFAAAGFRDPNKLTSLSIKVATRSYDGRLRKVVLGALASSFADPTAENKVAIAAHRLEHEQTDPQFEVVNAWAKLPEPVLQAAGIENIQSLIINEFYQEA